jgi:hypothetical protein
VVAGSSRSPPDPRSSPVPRRKVGWQQWLANKRLGLDLPGLPVPRCDLIDISIDRYFDDFVLGDVRLAPAGDLAPIVFTDEHSFLLAWLIFAAD